MCLYIREEERRGGYKEGTERKQERERGAQRGEGAVKGNGGRRERERDRAESGRASGRETEIRDEEREEREDNPLFFLGLWLRTPAISRPIKSRRGLRLLSLFYLFSLYFTLIGWHSPGHIAGQKRHPLPEEDSILPPGVWCPPVPSWYLPWSSRDLLQRRILSRRSRHLLLACPLHVQRWNLYATLRNSDGVAVWLCAPETEPRASP